MPMILLHPQGENRWMHPAMQQQQQRMPWGYRQGQARPDMRRENLVEPYGLSQREIRLVQADRQRRAMEAREAQWRLEQEYQARRQQLIEEERLARMALAQEEERRRRLLRAEYLYRQGGYANPLGLAGPRKRPSHACHHLRRHPSPPRDSSSLPIWAMLDEPGYLNGQEEAPEMEVEEKEKTQEQEQPQDDDDEELDDDDRELYMKVMSLLREMTSSDAEETTTPSEAEETASSMSGEEASKIIGRNGRAFLARVRASKAIAATKSLGNAKTTLEGLEKDLQTISAQSIRVKEGAVVDRDFLRVEDGLTRLLTQLDGIEERSVRPIRKDLVNQIQKDLDIIDHLREDAVDRESGIWEGELEVMFASDAESEVEAETEAETEGSTSEASGPESSGTEEEHEFELIDPSESD